MKKVLIATGIYPPDIGGPATYSKFLSEELPKRGFGVTVLSFGKVRHLPKLIRHVVYTWQLFWLSRSHDLVYAQDPVSVGLPTRIATRLSRRPYILKIVGDYAWEQGVQRFGVVDQLDIFARNKRYSLPVRILKFLERWVALGAQDIIVPSHYLKTLVTAWGVPPAKITVVYNAFIPPAFLAADRSAARSELQVNGQILVSVGRLVPWKGFPLLIEVMSALATRYPNLILYIIGSGPEEANLEQLIHERKLSNRVVLLGQLPRTEVLTWVQAADIFLLNTSYEGFSHQLLEVMAAGTAIVTTPVGGNPELITDHKTGVLVEYNHHVGWVRSIEELLEHAELRDALVDKARVKVGEFSRESMLNKLTPLLA